MSNLISPQRRGDAEPCPFCAGEKLCPDCLRKKKRAELAEWLGHDVMCLARIAQPVVTGMQDSIRFQASEMAEAARGIKFILARMAYDKQFGELFYLSESFVQLTEAYSILTGIDVDTVRDSVWPGCAAMLQKEVEA